MAGLPGPMTVRTLHGYLLERAGITPPAGAGADFWQRQLPDRTLAAVLNSSGEGEFDELVVDEAQDILRSQYLDVLDLSVKGGLGAGRWRLFGDFERQALFESDVTVEKLLTDRGEGAPAFSLRINCRNTPRIASMVYLLAGLEPAYARVLRADNGIEPELKYYSTRENEVALLVDTLDEMFRRGYTGSDIVVLSTKATDPAAQSLPAGVWRDRVRPIEGASAGQTRYASVHAFKGLEAPVIVLTDVAAIQDVRSQALFYVAITRATERIVCLVDGRVKAEVIGTLTSPHIAQPAAVANG
jgi:superfamily I DNA/RNA helicase